MSKLIKINQIFLFFINFFINFCKIIFIFIFFFYYLFLKIKIYRNEMKIIY